jgi:hypothetical protein
MRKRSIYVAATAASLALTGMFTFNSRWSSAAAAADDRSTNTAQTADQGRQSGAQDRQQQTQQGGDRIGNVASNDRQAIRDSLARVVDDATTPGKFNDLISQFTRSDQDRMSGREGQGARTGIGTGAARADAGTSSGGGTGIGTSGIGSGKTGTGTGTGTGIGSGTSTITGAGTGAGTGTGTSSRTGADAGTGAARTNTGGATGAGGDAVAMDTSDLDAKINQLRKDWQAKYHQEFAFRSSANQVLTETFARINTSDVGDAARTAGQRQGPSGTGTGANTPGSPRSDIGTGVGTSGAGTAGTNSAGINGNSTSGNSGVGVQRSDDTSGTGIGASTNTNARQAADRGDTYRAENSAVVLISGAPLATPVTLSFVSEAGTWKLEVPKTIDRQQLKANLIKHLDMVDRQKDTWPEDPKQAYQSVAQHVLKAFEDGLGQPHQGQDLGQPARQPLQPAQPGQPGQTPATIR